VADPQPPAPKPASKPAAAKPAPRADGVDPVMAKLIEDSVQVKSAQCPNCQSFIKPGSLICTSCGFNSATGKAQVTRVIKEKAPKAPKEPGTSVGERLSPMVVFVGTLALVGGPIVGGLVAEIEALAVVGYALLGILYLVLVVWCLIAAFRTSVGTGVMLLVASLIPLVNIIYFFYFMYVKQDDDRLRAAFTAYALVIIATLGLYFAGFNGGLTNDTPSTAAPAIPARSAAPPPAPSGAGSTTPAP
jgi:hypothetical protein